MDKLRAEEIALMRETPPEDKARQVLDLMQTGIHLKIASLRTRYPTASEDELERRLDAWLRGADG